MARPTPRIPSSDPSVEDMAAQLNTLLREKPEAPKQAPRQATPPPAATQPREPGIYFGLAAADYDADPPLGSSDIKRLLQAP
jgi:hypothetical protein